MNANAQLVSARADGRNYPLNCWWVAATSAEVTREPLGRWLLYRPVALYRTEAGQPVALDNRCIHRWAPLSDGYLEGDLIVCPYHGARFGPDGRCARFPTQATVPESAKVRSYAVIERGPFIWIWMGDDARRAEADLPPDFAWAQDPNWTVVRGSFKLDANYMLLHENVLDLTHFNYLHRNSFKITNRQPPVYRVEGDQVWLTDSYDSATLNPEERAAMGMDPFVLRQDEEAGFVTPAIHMVRAVTTRAPNPHLPEQTIQYVNHMLTPESPSKSHYWWLIGLGMPLPPEHAEAMRRTVEMGYNEDKVMLASIQETIERDGRARDYPEFSFNGDMGGIQARRALDRILAAD